MGIPIKPDAGSLRDDSSTSWWTRSFIVNRSTIKGDLYAGVVVGIMLIPQSMAYALLAGMPPIYGLYASLAPLIVYALLGSSRHLAVGTVAIDSLLILFALRTVAEPGTSQYIGYAFLFAAMVGVVHLLLAAGRMGYLVNLLSKPVIIGFVSAAAFMIGCSQIASVMGLSVVHTELVYVLLEQAIYQVRDTHLLSLCIGLASIWALVALRFWKKQIPGALLVVSAGILCTWWFQLEGEGVLVVGAVPTGLPTLTVPSFELDVVRQLAAPAVVLALLQFTNVISLGKSYAAEHEYAIQPNRELVALGVANIAGSFFQSYPVSGSFSRTALNADSGAQTSRANIIAALLVACSLLFLTSVLYYIPVPVLAAIIMVAAFGMIKWKEFRRLYQIKKSEGHLAVMTFFVTLGFGLQAGILVGLFASVAIILYRMSRPNVAFLGNLPGTRSYRDVRIHEDAAEVDGVLILRVDASFLYANADFLKDLILKKCHLEENEIHSVIIDASSVNDIDTTALEALFTIVKELQTRGIQLYFAGVHSHVVGILERSGLKGYVGPHRFFLSPHRAVQYIEATRKTHELTHPDDLV